MQICTVHWKNSAEYQTFPLVDDSFMQVLCHTIISQSRWISKLKLRKHLLQDKVIRSSRLQFKAVLQFVRTDSLSQQYFWPPYIAADSTFKGTLTREILPLVFFIRARLLTPWFIPQSRFEYKFKFAKIFEFLVDLRCGPPSGIGFFLQARANLKHECFSSCIVLLRHTHILHRLSL